MPAVASRNQGKSMFVKEELNNDPNANTEAINAAWRAAGMSGSISSSLISNVRTRLRLAGKLPGKRRQRAKAADAGAGGPVAGKRRGRPRHQQAGAVANGTAPVMSRGRERELMSLEVEIDRLLMRVVETGVLPEVEDALRKVRRQLYAGLVERS
jgi:hypothetical protein